MRKKLHTQSRTVRKGILTKNERKAVLEKTITRRDIRELSSIKTARSLTNRLNAIADDLEFLFEHKEFFGWYTESQTHNALNKIQGIIQKKLAHYELPVFKIAVTEVNGKREFFLKPLNFVKYSKNKLKKEEYEFFKKGLKPNERKLIWNYIEKKGLWFPLEKEKKYRWLEVRDILKKTM